MVTAALDCHDELTSGIGQAHGRCGDGSPVVHAKTHL